MIRKTVRPSRFWSDADQLVERRRRDRIEARGRLVEEQQLGIERERARKAGALDHAARQLGRDISGRRPAAAPPIAIL